MRRICLVGLIIAMVLCFTSCNRKSDAGSNDVAVFVPGILEGSPTYEMMAAGVGTAAEAAGVPVKIIEGGNDQSTWRSQLSSLAAEGQYALIVTSNPAMSEICNAVAAEHADQDFLVMDGSGLARGRVTDLVYNHMEQAFLIGYFAGLVTKSELKGANDALKVGMIVGQEYPQMNREIRPGFEMGLHLVDPSIELEFRTLGNWYDAEKSRELAESLYAEGVDVILTIAGGANQGVVAAAREVGAYVLWFDAESSDKASGTVLASAVIRQETLSEEWVSAWLAGDVQAGGVKHHGVADGYVDFPMDGRHFHKNIPDEIRDQMRDILERLKRGELTLTGFDD